jgi:hypothetical protein
MDTNTNWIKNLDAIDNCKKDIRTALERKGVNMTDVAFASYAEKINALQLESGDTSTPTPSAEYIYSNGYVEGESNDIGIYIPYEIKTKDDGGQFVLDEDGNYAIYLICPSEVRGITNRYMNFVFTIDVPEYYDMDDIIFEKQDINKNYVPYAYGLKVNPRYETIERKGVIYKSFVRAVSDGKDYATGDASTDKLYYRIKIKKQSI